MTKIIDDEQIQLWFDDVEIMVDSLIYCEFNKTQISSLEDLYHESQTLVKELSRKLNSLC